MYCLAGDVVARVYALGPDVALLAVHGRCCCQRRVSRCVGRREAVDRGRYLCDAADGVLQVTERLFRLLQLAADAFPVLPGQGDGAAMDVDDAIRKVMAVVLAEPEVYSFRRRMRLAGRVVGTQLGVFADDACLARDVLVAFDLALATRVAGLYGSGESAHVRGAVALPCLNAPGPVAQFGNAERPFFQRRLY